MPLEDIHTLDPLTSTLKKPPPARKFKENPRCFIKLLSLKLAQALRVLDALHCGTQSEHQVSNGSLYISDLVFHLRFVSFKYYVTIGN